MTERIITDNLPRLEYLFKTGEVITVKGAQFRVELFQGDRMVCRLVGLHAKGPVARAERRSAKREAMKAELRRIRQSK